MIKQATRKSTTADPNPYYKKLLCQTKKTCRLVRYRFTHFHHSNWVKHEKTLEYHKVSPDNTFHESLQLGKQAIAQLCANV